MVPSLRARIDNMVGPSIRDELIGHTILESMVSDLVSASSQESEEFLAFLMLQWSTAYMAVVASMFSDNFIAQGAHENALQMFRNSSGYANLTPVTRATADNLLSVVDTAVRRIASGNEVSIQVLRSALS